MRLLLQLRCASTEEAAVWLPGYSQNHSRIEINLLRLLRTSFFTCRLTKGLGYVHENVRFGPSLSNRYFVPFCDPFPAFFFFVFFAGVATVKLTTERVPHYPWKKINNTNHGAR